MRSLEGEWAENLNRMVGTLAIIKELPVTQPGLYLHLGCGPQVFDGWVNIDKYQKAEGVLNVDMADPPFSAKSADVIYSSHSLEHLPYRTAISALNKWGKILKDGGRLYLAIPDLEEVMRIMVDPEVSWESKWGWYVYNLFGFQISTSDYDTTYIGLDAPTDPGQFHTCGFSKESITRFLTSAGFEIEEIYNYDGWGSPSIFVQACKPKQS